ncbi:MULTISPECIES: ATP-dependent DNA helicase DinG [Stenotrophomonas]|uniref:ATP-dependent DNA helicase DinG n=1 Tax=Stenotrophomonas maltophilia TaxID=40324 RepID=A0A4S2CWC4_STEMA|nr:MULTISPECIES: ATP-dependent DNA helicase DinG [Stenotrophomonas]MBD3828564.1 ATP-dependent DNA helicase DinG [Stenotrophomonas sp.]QIO89916.1 ATP-dependent DNA helicase DinG [Stenotrophomonas rhizophila]TGY32835.1 ATP-dependent DNA helicase DinG [Stenotrophomonas maltophilia]HBS63222.1 ATP-dependent DNA helicase DinG [Stenotrophomonas sp.]
MTEKVEAPRALNDELKTVIRDAYAKLQANTPGFSTRRSQSQMIGVVSRALSHSGGVGVVEAPTGVGKSLGYLTAGVPIALATKKKLVISTGTVALQSQLFERDIPNFLKATGIEATVALAKGRTRYLCTRNAAEAHGDGAQEGMFEDEQPLFDRPLAPIEMDLAQSLSKAFLEGRWNGDLDNAPETISNTLRSRITTPASGCAGRKCAYSAQCAVLRSRNTVREAQIVVTNHALLLSALSIGDSDNGQPLIAPPGDMLLVLDEGHHIGNVAIDQGAASLAMDEMAKRTGRLQIVIAAAYRAVDKDKLGNLLPNEAIEVAARVSKQLKAFRDVVGRSWQPDPSAQEPMWRAPNGRLPDIWMADIEALADDTRALFNWAHAAHAQVAKGKPEDAARERLQRTLGMALEMIEQQHNLWAAWRREDKDGQPPTARWVTLSRDGDLILHGSPVSAANVLRKLLWDEVDSVVMTSATLTGGGDFQALAIDNGIPAEAEMVSLASPFDLPNQAELIVPAFPVTPDDRERHPKEVAKYLVSELDWGKGSIVLFTSRWKMEKVAELMPAAERKRVLVQGESAKQKMIDEHLRRTAAGEGSVLFGLNSFGEGLDLPGEACTTVVITQVPFAVPTDPQTSTLGEWFESRGLNAFNLIAIPHALRTLTQFAGRLIRTSTDTGRVIILDSRLLTRRYGKRIIDALPPFKRVIG